ncbi:MAG TPA: hypothetical protein VGS20_03800 [Candidatus Acidoferrales bacterium]|nr:hypothetical protein [Candidatus Acidoferrales bacterium]
MLGWALALAAPCAWPTLAPTGPAGGGQVEVRFRLDRPVITLHEPVVLEFSVRNDLAQPVTLDLGPGFVGRFRLGLVGPDGQTVQVGTSPPGDAGGGLYTLGRVTVQPGQEYRQRIVLNQWLEFRSVGMYSLAAELPRGIDLAGGVSLPPQKVRLRLEVRLRDAAALRRLCDELAARVESAQGVADASEPALELSYVDDPVAVPYLARVLAAPGLVEGVAIDGLERVGNQAAVEALIPALESKRDGVGILAREALGRLTRRTSDPALRKRIQEALARAGRGD